MFKMHAQFMREAIELAKNGWGRVSPNPPVGCVIVKENEIVGRGWHTRYGAPHAEPEALKNAGASASGATAYVTLMPCSHHGKTPPCTNALINAGIKEVVVAVDDPDPTSGNGREILEKAEIKVSTGILEEDAAWVMNGFLKYIRYGLPHITLKYAMTLDGKIATASGDSKWISNEESRSRVQLMRSQSDAILVGAGTARADNPRLNVRDGNEPQPFRVIADSNLSISADAAVFSEHGGKVIILAKENCDPAKKEALCAKGAEILECPATDEGRLDIKTGVNLLAKIYGIRKIMCEGGGHLAGSLLKEKLVDEVAAFIAPKILGASGISPVEGNYVQLMNKALQLINTETNFFDDNILITGRIPEKSKK